LVIKGLTPYQESTYLTLGIISHYLAKTTSDTFARSIKGTQEGGTSNKIQPNTKDFAWLAKTMVTELASLKQLLGLDDPLNWMTYHNLILMFTKV